MNKSYEITYNDWLLSKIASSFTEKAYVGNQELIDEQTKPKTMNFLFHTIFSFLLIFVGIVLLFNVLLHVFRPLYEENFIFIVFPTLLSVFSLIGAMIIVNKIRFKNAFIEKEGIGAINNTNHVPFIKLDNNYLDINLFNHHEIRIHIPIESINNVYLVDGDLSLFKSHSHLFTDKMDNILASAFNGSGLKDQKSKSYTTIDGEPKRIYKHHGMFQINKKKDYYNKYFGISIDGAVEQDGYFLFIFTKEEYHLFYVPQALIEKGFLKDLNQVLFKKLKKEIKTPSTYEKLHTREESADLNYKNPSYK